MIPYDEVVYGSFWNPLSFVSVIISLPDKLTCLTFNLPRWSSVTNPTLLDSNHVFPPSFSQICDCPSTKLELSSCTWTSKFVWNFSPLFRIYSLSNTYLTAVTVLQSVIWSARTYGASVFSEFVPLEVVYSTW